VYVPPSHLAGAAMLVFDVLQGGQQGVRAEAGGQTGDGIDIVGLVGRTDGGA
jgi:hypothetical protein